MSAVVSASTSFFFFFFFFGGSSDGSSTVVSPAAVVSMAETSAVVSASSAFLFFFFFSFFFFFAISSAASSTASVSRSGSIHGRDIRSRICILGLPLFLFLLFLFLLCNFFSSFFYSFSHYFNILPGQIPSLVKFQPVFYLLLQFGTKNTGTFITESINPAGNTALVREVPTDPPLVLGSSTANEAAVENQTVLGSVTTCLQSSE